MKRALTSRDKAQVIRSAQLLVEMKEKNIVSKAAEEELQKKKNKQKKDFGLRGRQIFVQIQVMQLICYLMPDYLFNLSVFSH